MPSMEWNPKDKVWTKTCIHCKKVYTSTGNKWDDAVKDFTELFHASYNRTRDSLDSRCKGCKNAKRINRMSVNVPELLKEQGYKCYLCERPFTQSKTTHVDHDHINGKTRRILCAYCNHLMAGVDNEEWLIKAIAYRDTYK